VRGRLCCIDFIQPPLTDEDLSWVYLVMRKVPLFTNKSDTVYITYFFLEHMGFFIFMLFTIQYLQ
jgi:hypothetical protein